MISDKLLTFAENTALNTGGAGNYVIGDQIDTEVGARGIGALTGAAALFLVITVTGAATSGGSATASFSLLTDADPAMGSPNVVITTAAIPVASLGAGTLVAVIALPVGFAWERYIGLRQTTGTAAFTGGTIDAFLTSTPPSRFHYPQNSAISY